MATIPVIDVPQQELGAGGFQPFAAPDFAARGVEPMKNFAPEQMVKQGQAVQQAGQTAMKIADMLQDQIDDADTKAADSFFTARAQKIMLDPQNGYMTTIGVQAKDRYPSVMDELNKVKEEAMQGLSNPRQRQMFERVAQRHMLSLSSQIDQHAIKQIRVYAAGESEARIGRYIEMGVADPSRRAEYLGVAVAEANQLSDLLGDPADSEQRKARIKKVTGTFHTGVASEMILSNNFGAAKAYVDKQFKDGQLDLGSYKTLSKQIDVGFKKEVGVTAGDRIFSSRAGPAGTDPATVIDWVIGIEGGYVENDAGKGPTKYGINGQANGLTDDQVKNLTMDQARDIYKKKYWNAIGADNLSPEMRAVAFDTAVNQGVGVAQQLLKQAGNDPAKFLQLRREKYQELIASNPDKWQQYEKSWMGRIDKLEASLGGKVPTLSSLLAETDSIEDPEARDIARSRIKSKWDEDGAVKAQDYQEKLIRAQDIAYATEGGWVNIPASLWADLKPQDRAQLMNRPKTSDSNTLFFLQNNPEMWVKGKIEQYRGLLTEADYRTFYAKGNAPDQSQKIIAATIDNEQFDNALLGAGLKNLLSPKKDSEDQRERIRLRAEFELRMDQEQQVKKRALTMQEKNELLVKLISPVKVKAVERGRIGQFFLGNVEEKRAYQVQDRGNILIPDEARSRIIKGFKDRGLQYDESMIIDAYLSTSDFRNVEKR